MKKRKGIWMTLIIAILSVAMILGTGVTSAFAATGVTTPIATAASFYTKFVYGEEYSFTQETKVLSPDGIETTIAANGKLKADQVGAYTIKTGEYSYNVSCALEKEYELRVAYGGAGIPTLIQKDGKFTAPSASMYYKNEKGDFVKDATQAVKFQVGFDATERNADGTHEITMNELGAFNVHYFCKLDNGKKYYSQDFTVTVEGSVKDSSKPTLNVVNVPGEISLNTKVTLPTATTGDDYDTNVKVEVSVQQFNGTNFVDVLEADVDDNGYGVEKTDAEAIVFDNKYSMSFYPIAEPNTEFRITYKATDDAGNVRTREPIIVKAIDKTAPVLKEIKDNQIPTKWGLNSVKKMDPADNKGTTELTNKKITFPRPDYIDNNDDNIEVSFEIKDTVNNKTVIRFDNINDVDADGNPKADGKATYKYNKGTNFYAENASFDKDGFVFDFANYVTGLADSGNASLSATGTYTATYRAQDNKPNTSTKSFDITLEDTFIDKDRPSASVEFDMDYLYVGKQEEKITLPSLIVSDNADTRPNKTFTLISVALATETVNNSNSIVVDGGESAVVVMDGTTPKLIVNKDKYNEKTLTLKKTLGYSLVVSDDVGNQNDVKTADADKFKTLIPVLTDTDFASAASLQTTGLTMSFTADDDHMVGNKVDLGLFTVTPGSVALREYTGFEITLLDPEDKQVSKPLSMTYYFDGAKFVIDDLAFTPGVAGEYKMYIRAFDVTGKSVLSLYTFDILAKGASGGGDPGINSTGVIEPTGGIYTTYQLKNKHVPTTPADIDQTAKYIVRQISATGKFSLTDTKFCAYNTGNYEFKDGYFTDKTAGAFKELSEDITKETTKYNFVAKMNGTVAWEVQGKMPAYVPLNQEVRLPGVIGNAGFENASIEVSMTFKDKSVLVGTETDPTEGKFLKFDTTTKQYYFTPEQDGTYVIQYKPKTGSVTPVSYTIKAGDCVAPSFTVTDVADNERMPEGGNFTFKKVEVSSAEDNTETAIKKVKFTKRLLDPTGQQVYNIEGTGKDFANAVKQTSTDGYKLDKTGTYTVEYSVTDEIGNKSTQKYTLSVSAKKTQNPISTKIISTVLIIVGVLLIAGVILYFVRFRKIKNK